MCKEFICELLGCGSEQDIPSSYIWNEFDASEVYTILRAEFPDAQILLSDNLYKITSIDDLLLYLKSDITDIYKYISEYYDCDDFSYSLMGQLSNPQWGSTAFGILWTDVPDGAHAVNCFIDKNRDVWIIEPQNDKIFRLPSIWKPYLVMM
jgi:hypothetical protein